MNNDYQYNHMTTAQSFAQFIQSNDKKNTLNSLEELVKNNVISWKDIHKIIHNHLLNENGNTP